MYVCDIYVYIQCVLIYLYVPRVSIVYVYVYVYASPPYAPWDKATNTKIYVLEKPTVSYNLAVMLFINCTILSFCTRNNVSILNANVETFSESFVSRAKKRAGAPRAFSIREQILYSHENTFSMYACREC